MRRADDLGELRERLQRTALTALGLLVLALLFAFLVPRRAEIASGLAAARQPAVAHTVAAGSPPMVPKSESASGPRIANRPIPTIPSVSADIAAPVEPEQPPSATASTASSNEAAPGAAAAQAPADRPLELLARPVALDTGTLLVGQAKIRLEGIVPVSVTERCGEGSDAWFCGSEARSRFRAWLRARSIRCAAPPNFGTAPDEIVAACDLSGEDIGNWLVSNGWARADAGGPYAEAEAKAKSAKLGIWAARRRTD